MSKELRQQVTMKIFKMGIFYGKSLPQEEISMFVDVMHDYFKRDYSLYIAAMDDYMADTNNKFFPSIAALSPYITPKASQQDIAVDMTRMLIRVIKSKQHSWTEGYFGVDGNYWLSKNKRFSSWREAAVEEVGELGVEVINRYGWKNLCDAYFSAHDEGTFAAQLREFIKARQNIIVAGAQESVMALPEKRQVAALMDTMCKDMNKAIGWKEEPMHKYTLASFPEETKPLSNSEYDRVAFEFDERNSRNNGGS